MLDDLPSPPQNCQGNLPLKSSVQFTPHPQKPPGKIYPSNRLYNLPPHPPTPEITREDLPLKSSVWFTPTPPPPPKSPGKIYPSNRLYNLPPEIAFISTFLPPKTDIN